MSMTRYVNPLPRPKTLSNEDPVPGLNIEGVLFLDQKGIQATQTMWSCVVTVLVFLAGF